MVQPPSNVHAPLLRLPHALPADPPAKPANRQPTGRKVRARARAIREVVVVDVGGRFGDVVEDLDRAIQLALADGPRGVVCDLSNVLEGTHPEVVEVLATAGRHVRDWPGIPVAVACPDPRVREALRAHPLTGFRPSPTSHAVVT